MDAVVTRQASTQPPSAETTWYAWVLRRWRELTPSPDGSRQFVGTITEVGATLLALYYAAVSIVASTVYARLRSDVLSLLVRERVNSTYSRLVALATCYGALLLLAQALGYEPGLVSLLALGVLSAIAILSFMSIGMRAFYFFDPNLLMGYAIVDLRDHISTAIAPRFGWSEPAFQDHARRSASSTLDTCAAVIESTSQKGQLQAALPDSVISAIRFMALYAENKHRIPSDSHWFARTPSEPEWLTSGYEALSLTARTATVPATRQIVREHWLEKRIADLASATIRNLLDRGDTDGVHSIAMAIARRMKPLAGRFLIDEAQLLLRALRPVADYVATPVNQSDEDGRDSQRDRLALTDLYGYALVDVVLGLSEACERLSSTASGCGLGRTRWRRRRSLYMDVRPREAIKQLEWLWSRLRFERRIEGRVLTPKWYIEQVVAFGFRRFLERAIAVLREELAYFTDTFARELQQQAQHRCLAQLIRRGLELCEKTRVHSQSYRHCDETLDGRRCAQDIRWPQVDWEELSGAIQDTEDRLLALLAQSVPHIAKDDAVDDLPDYFGHFYVLLAEHAYCAIEADKPELFGKLFPAVFFASLEARSKLLEQLQQQEPQTRVAYAVDPLLDLLALSGYALIYSELHNQLHWKIAKGVWDRFMQSQEEPKAVLQLLASTTDLRHSFFGLTPRQIVRTEWQQRLARRLRSHGLLGRHDWPTRRTRRHESNIIEALTRDSGDMLFEHAEDVFVAIYLLSLPDAEGLEPPHGAARFLDAIRRVSAELIQGHEES